MKISRTEKIYLIVLLVVVFIFLGYKFGYSKYEEYLTNLEAEHDEVQNEYDDIQNSIKYKPIYEKKIEESSAEVKEKSMGYSYKINQDDLIIKLDKLFTDNEIAAAGITFSDVTNAISSDTDTSNTNNVKKINLSLSFSCTYDNLLKFIDDLHDGTYKSSINNIVVISNESGIVSGNMNFELFAASNEFTKENEYTWEDVIESGKDNLFDTSELKSSAEIKDYDFLLDLRPTSSDIPSVSVQKIGYESDSAIYSDENSAVQVEISVKEENEIYKYKYTVGTINYPSGGEYETFELAEDGSLGLKIYSNARNSSADTSGVQITIDNQTDLNVYAHIIDDDSIRPRAVFTDVGGVNITNE